jgi:LAO/AO transport system kinase
MSALHNQGVGDFWGKVSEYQKLQQNNGRFASKRKQQSRAWMWERIESGLKQRFRSHPAVKGQLESTTQSVLNGQLPASTAARQLLELFH